MSVFTALFSGVNGINSNGEAVSVIGDNIANVNTNGFKSSRAEFEDIMAGSSSVSGLGSRLAGVTSILSQGGFESTSVVTDMAIDGKGFFAMRDTADSTTYYSRSGQLSVDKDGYLVNSNEQRLQGYTVDSAGDLGTTATDLLLSYAPVNPKATSTATIKANLDSSETVPAAFSAANPVATSNFAVGMTVYDSIGNDHLVTTYFRKNGAGDWQWYCVAGASEATSGVATTCASGTLTFDSSGRQTAFTQATNDFDFTGGPAQSQSITFNMGSLYPASSGTDGLTQFGSASTLSSLTQNGYQSGSLTTVEIDTDGTISGNYTNGTSATLGQVVLATFANEQGLKRVGGNVFASSLTSGEALLAGAKTGGRGEILSQTLEQSNVDLANELIKMVIIQRGFQANSRTISVVNELLGSLVSLGN